MITSKLKKTLVSKSKTLEPILRVGKNGLTDSVIIEIKKQLHKKKLIKIKFLKAAIGDKKKKEFAKEVAERTNSILIHQVGFVVVLYRT